MTLNLYTVIRERAGDGSLFEVADIRGRVVSASPRNWRSCMALAEHLEADAYAERCQLMVDERE